MRTLVISSAIFLATLIAFPQGASAQKPRKLPDEWNEGSIMLSDETVLKGLVRYDKKKGYASFLDGKETITYKNSNILMMTFYDEKFKRQRTFYSLPYEDNATLYEVMAEYKKLVVLSFMGPIVKREKHLRDLSSIWTTETHSSGSLRETTQLETLYFMNAEGLVKQYMDIAHQEDGDLSMFTWRDEKSKVIEIYEETIEEMVSPSIFIQLKKYADDNHLNLKSRKDLYAILEGSREILDGI
jgi:hypothetical protein